MQANDYVRLTDNEMFTLLVIAGVIKNSIPDELKESALLLYDNGVYKLREGA